jgi:Ca-activated chloride channel family protein
VRKELPMPNFTKAAWLAAFLASPAICSAQATVPVKAPDTTPRAAVAATDAKPTSGWPTVTLNVLVEDKKEQPITGELTPDFQVQEDTVKQTVQSIAGPGEPVSLGILFDISGSMEKNRALVRDAAAALVKHLPPQSEVMVSVFAEKAVVVVPFSPVTAIDLTLFGRWKYAHHTALNDAVIETMPQFVRTARYPRRALVVITDGEEDRSRHGGRAFLQSTEIPGAPYVYVLLIADPYAPDLQEVQRFADFGWSNGTRAVHVSGESSHEVLAGANEITVCIASQYAITYTTAETLRDKRLRKVVIGWPEAGRGMKIMSLKEYMVPAP